MTEVKITKIGFEELFPTGQFANKRLWMEVSVDMDLYSDQKEINEVYEAAQLSVEAAFRSMNPDLAPPLHDFNSGGPEVVQVERQLGFSIVDIMSCRDLPTLESYKLLVKGKPELETAYEKRRQQISG